MQRPSSQRGGAAAAVSDSSKVRHNSATSRLFPIPASPLMKRTPPEPPSVRSSAASASPSSRSRPTSRVSTPSRPRTLRPSASARSTTVARTGSPFPLSSSSTGSPHTKSGSACRRVAPSTSTVPGSALACKRAAVLTVSPKAAYSTLWPPPISPRTTGPVVTPTRTPKPRTPQPRSTSSP